MRERWGLDGSGQPDLAQRRPLLGSGGLVLAFGGAVPLFARVAEFVLGERQETSDEPFIKFPERCAATQPCR